MRQTRINVFFMSAYSTYCNECLQYNELDKQKSFADFCKSNKNYLLQQYVAHRRANKKNTTH